MLFSFQCCIWNNPWQQQTHLNSTSWSLNMTQAWHMTFDLFWQHLSCEMPLKGCEWTSYAMSFVTSLMGSLWCVWAPSVNTGVHATWHWKTSMEMLAVFLTNASVGMWCYLRAPTVTFCIRNTTHDSHGAAMGPLPAFLCLSSVTWTLHAKRQRFALFETTGKHGVFVKVSQWLYLATSLKSMYWYNKTL